MTWSEAVLRRFVCRRVLGHIYPSEETYARCRRCGWPRGLQGEVRYPPGRPNPLRVAFRAVCIYEAVALDPSGRLPTITTVATRRHRWLRPLLVAALIADLWWDNP